MIGSVNWEFFCWIPNNIVENVVKYQEVGCIQPAFDIPAILHRPSAHAEAFSWAAGVWHCRPDELTLVHVDLTRFASVPESISMVGIFVSAADQLTAKTVPEIEVSARMGIPGGM